MVAIYNNVISNENNIDFVKQGKRYIKRRYENISSKDIIVYEDRNPHRSYKKKEKFMKLLNELQQYKIKTIICYDYSKITNSCKEFVELLDYLALFQVELIGINNKFQT